MADWTVTEGDPWSVTFRPTDDERVVRLHVGNFTVHLPALEAHKLGSALHAASGLDGSSTTDGSEAMGGPPVFLQDGTPVPEPHASRVRAIHEALHRGEDMGGDPVATVAYPDLKPGDVIVRAVSPIGYEVRRRG